MKFLVNNPYFFWALLAMPLAPLLVDLFIGSVAAEQLLHPTGEYAARFMIVALTITPLRTVFPKARWPVWLMHRRRAFGVAAFIYALIHTALYLTDMNDLSAVWAEFFALGIWTGWAALAIFLPLGITSNNPLQRALGRRWKSLQRLAYAAALFTLAHWLLIHNDSGAALAHFIPLVLLQAWRIQIRWQLASRAKPAI